MRDLRPAGEAYAHFVIGRYVETCANEIGAQRCEGPCYDEDAEDAGGGHVAHTHTHRPRFLLIRMAGRRPAQDTGGKARA